MRKEKQLMNRVLSSLLALALVLTGLYIPEVTAQAAEEELVVYYDFVSQNDQAAQIPDASQHGRFAEVEAVSGSARGKYRIVDANIYGNEVKALELDGGEDGPYLTLPEGILDGCESVTISSWVKLTTDSGYQRVWDFGTGTDKYIYMLSDGWNTGFTGYASGISTSGWQGEVGVEKGTNFARNRWILTTLVMNGSEMSLYENGELVGTKDTGLKVSDLGHTTSNYIAYGQFGNDPAAGQFAEFKIYNRALSAEEVKAMYNVTDEGIVSSDVNELDLGDLSAITENMELPSKGVNGSDITWESDSNAITVGDKNEAGNYVAAVKRPTAGEGDLTVKLTATLTYNGKSGTKEFTATVKPEYSDQQKAEHDKEAAIAAVGDLSAVITKEILLPGEGEWGSSIAWTWEGDAGVITIPAQKGEDGNFTAAVTRPAIGSPDAAGKLKAEVAFGTAKEAIEIPVTVKAYRESIGIKETEEIKVNTLAGHSPSLPNYVKATYDDGSVDKLKVRWPDAIEEDKYAQAGQAFTVEGEIVGEKNKVTAEVTVVTEEEIASAKTASFDLSDISLDKIGQDGSILTQNRDRDIAYLKLLDNKRMLYDFYMTFGENDKIKDVQPLGGWDEPTGLLRGHSTGHYMSALALAYASTGDEELKTKLNEMVSELHRLQQKSKGDPAAFKISGTGMEDSLDVNTWSKDPDEWGEGFLSAYSPDQFALLEVYAPYGSPGTGIWAPYYTMHKLLAGFLDAYTYTGNKEALATAKGLGKWVYKRLSACTQEQLTKMWGMYIAGELGGMNESMSQLYIYAKEDGDADADIYLQGAKLFDNTVFFDNLAKNQDDIKGRHANQHIPQIIGALKTYEATVDKGSAEKKYYDIAENFWQMVVSRYAYSIGGVGVGEAFPDPYAQAQNIRGNENCETCAAYNMMKLTKMLNNYNPDDAEYMDYYERTLYNQILASQTPNVTDNRHNGTTYMLPIGPAGRRSFGGDYDSFTCCHGTGMENHVKYQEAAYTKSADTLYVGLYLPSTVQWEEKGVKVTQETAFPSETTKLTVAQADGKTAQAFNMKLRVPYWATEGFTVTVNGEEKVKDPEISTYVTLEGIQAGDVIEVNMPWTLHLDKTPDKLGASMVASIMYGPYVMAARSSSSDWLRLVLPEHLADVVKTGVNEANGFPTLSVSGLNFAPMFAPEYATEAYHTYFKVLQTADDGSVWHEVSVNNRTPLNGTVETTAEAEMTKEGEDLTITLIPKEGYVLKKLIVNGEQVEASNNQYVVKDVRNKVSIEAIFRPPVLNQDNLEYSADVSANALFDYYGQPTDIMQNWEPTSSISSAGGYGGWVNWWTGPGQESYLQYTWDEPVAMNTFNVYWRVAYNGTDTDWMHVPGTIKVMYLDGGSWKEANMTSKYEDIIKLHQYNTITFDDITTTAVRMVMTTYNGPDTQAGCTGVYRWKVSLIQKPEESVIKTDLAAAIKKAEGLTAGDYTEESWKAVEDALKEAQAVNADKDATQEQVNAAEKKLTDAINALAKKPIVIPPNKTLLAAAVKKAEGLKADDYTAASWKAVEDALKEAQAVNADQDATQAQVNAAEKKLTDAINALEEKPAVVAADKTKLAAAVKKAEGLKAGDYTEDSWKAVDSALKDAKAVNADKDATQAQVDAAEKKLTDAVNALKKKPVEVKPGTPSSVKAAWAGTKNVKVTWKAAKNATKYEVYRSYSSSKNAKFTRVGTVTKKNTYAFTDKKATPGKTAYYKVIAYNGKVKGSYSKVSKAYVLKAPASLKAVSKKSGKKRNVTVSFKKATGASGYEIYRATKKNGKYKRVATLNSKTVKKVFKNAKKGTYYYKVRAYKLSGKNKVYTAFTSIKPVKVK